MTEPIEIFQPHLELFGGEERVILAICRALHASGRPVRVLCYRETMRFSDHADFPLTVLALDPAGGPIARAQSLGRHLAARAKAGAPTPMLCNIQSAYHAGFAVRTPYHLRIPDTFRLLTPPGSNGIVQRVRGGVTDHLVGRGIRAARSFTTNTGALADEMERLYRRRPGVLSLGGVAPRQAPAPKAVRGAVRILSVSRLEASKRIDWIIAALGERARQGRRDWSLDVVGKGPAREALEAAAAAHGVADRVTFHGFVDDARLDALFGQAHLFAMPAIQGYGIPAIEAVSHRLAVVLTPESGVAEVLADTPWAIVAPADPAGFAHGLDAAIDRVATTDLLRSALPELPTEESWAERLIATTDW